jgi:bifunctional non-homologous end joining protein LigD
MDSLREYRRKRPPGHSPEPRAGRRSPGGNTFVIQRHDATRLHYDLRLEMNGVLKSWAVPKGPSLDPGVRRLAIQTEDHPLDYGSFEGKIPEGNYGAGEVILWDRGTYSLEGSLSAPEQLDRGEIKFVLDGEKLQGSFVLVRLKDPSAKKEWLLIKHRDQNVQTDWNIEEHNRSVKSGKPPGPPRHPSRAAKNSVQSGGVSTSVQNINKAVKAPFPENLTPALASDAEQPFSRKDWLFEIKWDGMRALAFVRNGQTRLLSRSSRDATSEFPEFKNLTSHLRAQQAVLDGEIVVLDHKGRSDFQRLQSRFGIANPSGKLQEEAPATFYFFDILYCDGFDVRRAPLLERKELLSKVIVPSDTIRISDYVEEKGAELFEVATQNGLEGVIAKQTDSAYPTGRSNHWLKFKSVRELDAVVGGWTDPRGSRKYFGSLLVGQYKNDELHYIGSVGSGFSSSLEQSLFRKLQALTTKQPPFINDPKTRELSHWVRPELVARVGYTEWTFDLHLRHPRFLGLQPDRSPQDSKFASEESGVVPSPILRKEKTVSIKRPSQKKTQPSQNLKQVLAAIQNKQKKEIHLHLDGRDLKLTHLDKIYFPKAGYSKRDVLFYYATVSPFLLPFLKDRPLVLHRFPNGIGKPAFYQKEAGSSIPDWIRTVEIFSETKGHNVSFFLIDDLPSLLYMSNLGCIEHNPFSARADDLDQPDYMFFDLDPSEGCPFPGVVRAAKAIINVLQRARLKFFIKTSGATGLHIFIPIVRKYDFAQVRALLDIIARLADAEEPGLLTRTFKVHDRPKNSVFVDVRQNAYAQSLASVFSLRPREGAPVSTPLSLQELQPVLRPERWNIESVLAGLKTRSRLWANFWQTKQTLEAALSALEKR